MTTTLSRGGLRSWGLDGDVAVDWRQNGACGTHNPDWWVLDGQPTLTNAQAARICQGCPVLTQCADWAERKRPIGMVYAAKAWVRVRGVSAHTGQSQPKDILVRACQRCGTRYATISPHQRHCASCRATLTAREKETKARRVEILMTERYGPLDALEKERPP